MKWPGHQALWTHLGGAVPPDPWGLLGFVLVSGSGVLCGLCLCCQGRCWAGIPTTEACLTPGHPRDPAGPSPSRAGVDRPGSGRWVGGRAAELSPLHPRDAQRQQRPPGVCPDPPPGQLPWRPGPPPAPALFGPQLGLITPLAILLECVHFSLGLLGRGDGAPGVVKEEA